MLISKALGPVEFQFTDPQDVQKYGDRWYRYSEADLIRTPARDLIDLEQKLGMPIVDVMNGMRMSSVLGDLAAAWIGVRWHDSELAGSFDDFNPLVLQIVWRAAGKDQGATEKAAPETDTPAPQDDGSPDALSPNLTSESPDTVVLQTSPIAG